MNKLSILVLLLTLAAGCSKKSSTAPGGGPDTTGNTNNPPASFAGNYIMATNDASRKIELYEPVIDDWNKPEAKKWSWGPTTALGFSSQEVTSFGGGTDVKLRHVKAWHDSTFIAVTDNGMAAIIPYPAGTKRWSMLISGNLHSAELLPNGNIAIAASDGNWVRVYASSQGPNASAYAQYNLNAAHAALWDSLNNVVWVIGQDPANATHILTALTVGGTPDNPTLTEDLSRRSALPSVWGHDVSPFYGDMNRLWVSTNSAAYVYNKTTKTFVVAPGTANRIFVKAISNQASGQIVETQPDANKSPRPPVNCSLNDWSTSTVEFYSSNGTLQGSRVINGACVYRARVLTDKYQ
ncbi:MAG: hypothetical protein JST39_16070 [Bacteroidetes bacterium]|nr:hypothetical protein [Bacteroidota bacterium]